MVTLERGDGRPVAVGSERGGIPLVGVLGLSESNVGTKLNRLRQRLRELAKTEMPR